MSIIDGKEVAQSVFDKLTTIVSDLKAKHDVQPGLAVVLIGNDPASEVYVGMKGKRCEKLNIYSEKHVMPADSTQEDVMKMVEQLNNNPKIHGILVQSPPPPQIDERAVIDAISPDKDVDCFHPYNVGKMAIGDDDGFFPCTPYGCMMLLKYYGIETSGKHAVVIGRSNIVGKPMSMLLGRKGSNANCTVTVCHSRTQNMPALTAQADILVAAIGKANFVTADMVKDGAVVVDVGINRLDDPTAKRGYRLVGDVDYEAVSKKASYITPVPGGVGPMTIAVLMTNAVKACCRLNKLPFEFDL